MYHYPTMKIIRVLFALWSILFFFSAGCCSLPRDDAVAQFKRKHPGEAKQYIYIHPISIDTYALLFNLKSRVISSIGETLKARVGNTPDLVEYAQRISADEALANQEWDRFCREFEEAITNGGVICQYAKSNGEIKDIGFLVLKSGSVVKSESWNTYPIPFHHSGSPKAK
jgi:hypothetical protein